MMFESGRHLKLKCFIYWLMTVILFVIVMRFIGEAIDVDFNLFSHLCGIAVLTYHSIKDYRKNERALRRSGRRVN